MRITEFLTTNTRKSWKRMRSGYARYSRRRTRPDATKTSPETAAIMENRAKLLLYSGDFACQQKQMQQVQMQGQIPHIHACQHVPRFFAWARTTARGDCPVRFHLSGVSVASATPGNAIGKKMSPVGLFEPFAALQIVAATPRMYICIPRV